MGTNMDFQAVFRQHLNFEKKYLMMVFLYKLFLDKSHGLLIIIEFYCDNFNSHVLGENSNIYGEKA